MLQIAHLKRDLSLLSLRSIIILMSACVSLCVVESSMCVVDVGFIGVGVRVAGVAVVIVAE